MTDRELDVEVAEKVMGYSGRMEIARGRSLKTCGDFFPAFRKPPKNHSGWGNYSTHWTRDGMKFYCGKPFDWHPVHPYSTSIKCAWAVVEKMREMGDCFDFTIGITTCITQLNKPCHWGAVFIEITDEKSYPGWADTAPRAICLAALKAVEKKP